MGLFTRISAEPHIRLITAATLEKYNYHVLTAGDGTEAIALYSQQENINLVITDMAMPYMDGAALTRALRNINPNVKVIAASGLIGEDKTDLKFDEFLLKPFTAEKLLKTVAAVLSRK